MCLIREPVLAEEASPGCPFSGCYVRLAEKGTVLNLHTLLYSGKMLTKSCYHFTWARDMVASYSLCGFGLYIIDGDNALGKVLVKHKVLGPVVLCPGVKMPSM